MLMEYIDLLRKIVVASSLEGIETRKREIMLAIDTIAVDPMFDFKATVTPIEMILKPIITVRVLPFEQEKNEDISVIIRTPVPADFLYVRRWMKSHWDEGDDIIVQELQLKTVSVFTMAINAEDFGDETLGKVQIDTRTDDQCKTLYESRYNKIRFMSPALVDRIYRAIIDLHNHCRDVRKDFKEAVKKA